MPEQPSELDKLIKLVRWIVIGVVVVVVFPPVAEFVVLFVANLFSKH